MAEHKEVPSLAFSGFVRVVTVFGVIHKLAPAHVAVAAATGAAAVLQDVLAAGANQQ